MTQPEEPTSEQGPVPIRLPGRAKRIGNYFFGLLVVKDEYWVARIIGGGTRWFFDLLKNVIAVGVLVAIADKTGSPTLHLLSRVATGLLGVFAMTPTLGWYLDILHPVRSEPVPIGALVTTKVLIMLAVVWLAYFELPAAIEAVAHWNQK